MKKNLIFFILISLTCVINAQTKSLKYEISRKQLNEAKKVADLIPDLSSDCEIKSCLFSMITSGKLAEYQLSGDVLWMQKDMKNVEKIFIEAIKSNCNDLTKVKYIILPKKD